MRRRSSSLWAANEPATDGPHACVHRAPRRAACKAAQACLVRFAAAARRLMGGRLKPVRRGGSRPGGRVAGNRGCRRKAVLCNSTLRPAGLEIVFGPRGAMIDRAPRRRGAAHGRDGEVGPGGGGPPYVGRPRRGSRGRGSAGRPHGTATVSSAGRPGRRPPPHLKKRRAGSIGRPGSAASPRPQPT